ncbi:putative lyase [Luteitalea pratensis]|uniref:Putative lyase n=1 Tax=Luteitalea pratensis TaxID=1855912 RepID=A0A143PML6_LUTPR|nr:nuclear transport factor 2 family protein [Luteitalea pratensis]AMY09453.1 putative lyase [Luteitalea pratensis]
MTIAISTPGIHHLALRSTNLLRSRRFYGDTLGFPVVHESTTLFLFLAGSTAVAVRGPEEGTPANDVFNPFRAGLDHVALGCTDEKELERVAKALADAAVENTGVRLDPLFDRRYVAFKDPDRIAWELYMAPNPRLAAVDAYFEGLRRGNVDQVPFSPSVRFQGPLGPRIDGAEDVRQFLRGVFPIIKDVRIQQMMSEGECVATRFELDTVHGTIPAFDWFRVVDGLIVEARPYYDPRPITSAMEAAALELNDS